MTSAAADLTDARAQFWSEGACIVRDALPPADLQGAGRLGLHEARTAP